RPKGINQKNNHASSSNWQAGRSSWRATGWATCTTVRSPTPTLARGSHAATARLVTRPSKERSRRRHGISGRRAGFRQDDLRHGAAEHTEIIGHRVTGSQRIIHCSASDPRPHSTKKNNCTKSRGATENHSLFGVGPAPGDAGRL